MTADATAIWISLASASVSALALGWNIYRDVLLRPRLKVDFGKRVLMSPQMPSQKVIGLYITNFGPGKCKISGITLRRHTLLLRLLKKCEYAEWLPDYYNPLNPRVPHTLDIGDSASFVWAYNSERLGLTKFNQIGVRDSFGRVHWASKSEYLITSAMILVEFGG